MAGRIPSLGDASEVDVSGSLPSRCRVCGDRDLSGFLDLAGVPVTTGSLAASEAEALSVPRGRIDLAWCSRCAMIENRAFDPELVAYTPSYEASLHFSPEFQRYARSLADRLIQRYSLFDRQVIEVGCGKGEFLRLLCEHGPNRGLGFDPSYGGEQDSWASGGSMRVLAEMYSQAHSQEEVDLVCARHVLEHVIDPGHFLRGLRRAMGDRKVPLYLEVPDARFVFGSGKIWDVIYEHCSYFAPTALVRVVEDAGFEVTEVDSSFGGQYLYLEAVSTGGWAAPATPTPTPTPAAGVAEVAGLVASFGRARAREEERWRSAIPAGRRVALWGAGSKGITFLNTLPPDARVDAVVDLNPRKWGRHVPGSGQRVIGPDELGHYRPDLVLVANPIYLGEIRAELAGRGIDAELACL